jgi:hypothetical protein
MAIAELRDRSGPSADASVAELIRRASDDVSRLVRDELQLARVELTTKARNAGVGAGLIGAGVGLAWYGVGVLIAAAVLGLAVVLPAWLAALLVGVVLLLVAGTTALVGRGRLQRAVPPVPVEAMNSVRADVDRIKAGARR